MIDIFGLMYICCFGYSQKCVPYEKNSRSGRQTNKQKPMPLASRLIAVTLGHVNKAPSHPQCLVCKIRILPAPHKLRKKRNPEVPRWKIVEGVVYVCKTTVQSVFVYATSGFLKSQGLNTSPSPFTIHIRNLLFNEI